MFQEACHLPLPDLMVISQPSACVRDRIVIAIDLAIVLFLGAGFWVLGFFDPGGNFNFDG